MNEENGQSVRLLAVYLYAPNTRYLTPTHPLDDDKNINESILHLKA